MIARLTSVHTPPKQTFHDLPSLTCLVSHSLSLNKIGDAGAKEIAAALKTNNTLQTLE